MKLRFCFACLTGLGAGAGSLSAQLPAAVPTPGIGVTTTLTATSQYLFRGLRLSDGGLQPSVEIASGNLIVGAWGNFPVNGDKVPGSSDPELDLYGAYNVALPRNLTLTPGFTLYTFPQAPTNAGFYRSTFEPNLALSYVVDGFKLTPKVHYDVRLRGATWELTAFYVYPLAGLGAELDFTLTFGTYKWKDAASGSSPDVKAWGDYWLAGVAIPFQLSAAARVTVGFAFAEGRRAYTKAGDFGRVPNSLALGRGVATVSYAVSF